MGTYYDIVCPQSKDVLRLWKVANLWERLEYLFQNGLLAMKRTEPDSSYTNFIVLAQAFFHIVEMEVPQAKTWLEDHVNCKLFFVDSEYSDAFNYYIGYNITDSQ